MELLSKLKLGIFPEELVRVGLTDFFTRHLHQEHQRLDDARHLDHVHGLDLFHVLLPGASRKDLGRGAESVLANLDFALLFIFIFLGLVGDKLLNGALDSVERGKGSLLLDRGFLAQLLDLAVAIGHERLFLGAFPILTEGLHNLEHEALLVIRKLAVLAHRIEAHDELLLRRDERSVLILRPLAGLGFEGLIRGLSCFFFGSLLIFKLVDLLLKLSLPGSYILEVSSRGFQSLIS